MEFIKRVAGTYKEEICSVVIALVIIGIVYHLGIIRY